MEKIRKENNWTVPNLLTALRIVLIPFFVWKYLSGARVAALAIFLIVQLSDLLDGMIARRFGQVTSLGKLLDPIADKALLISVLTCFVIAGVMPVWAFLAILAKELLMVIGGAWALRKQIIVQAKLPGKLATALFAAMVICMLLGWRPVDQILMYAALLTAYCALVFYAADAAKEFSRKA